MTETYGKRVSIRLDDIPQSLLTNAMNCIRIFAAEYPDRHGIRDGCIYLPAASSPPPYALYVYRTNGGQLVCRMASGGSDD